jgi:lipopolysaccharide export system protein LptA
MAFARNSTLLPGLVLLAGAAAGAGAAQPVAAVTGGPSSPEKQVCSQSASPASGQPRIGVDAASSEIDYKTNTVVFKNIVVCQGNIKVRAQKARATGRSLNFQNSEWEFDGNVRINAPPRGSLQSDQATLEVRDDRIARATVTGNPAHFEQRRTDGLGTEQGHAKQMVYDVKAGTVTLAGDAWISQGRNEISGPSIVYDILKQSVQASSSGSSQRVHITITPQTLHKKKPTPPRAAPPAAAPPGTKTPAVPRSAVPPLRRP